MAESATALQAFMQDLQAYGVTDLVGEELFVSVADQLVSFEASSSVQASKPRQKPKEVEVFATPDLPVAEQGNALPVSPMVGADDVVEPPKTEIKGAATNAQEVADQLARLKSTLSTKTPELKKEVVVDEAQLQKAFKFFEGEPKADVLVIDFVDYNFPKGKLIPDPEQWALLQNIAKAAQWDIEKSHMLFVSRQKEDGSFYALSEEKLLSQLLHQTLNTVEKSQLFAFGQQSLKLLSTTPSGDEKSLQSTKEGAEAQVIALPALLSMVKQPLLKKNAWFKILSAMQKNTNISTSN